MVYALAGRLVGVHGGWNKREIGWAHEARAEMTYLRPVDDGWVVLRRWWERM